VLYAKCSTDHVQPLTSCNSLERKVPPIVHVGYT